MPICVNIIGNIINDHMKILFSWCEIKDKSICSVDAALFSCSLSTKPWQDSGGGFKVAQYLPGLEGVVIGRGFNITCLVDQKDS